MRGFPVDAEWIKLSYNTYGVAFSYESSGGEDKGLFLLRNVSPIYVSGFCSYVNETQDSSTVVLI
jgi:hypothetical protein